jgi:hypothetical protein
VQKKHSRLQKFMVCEPTWRSSQPHSGKLGHNHSARGVKFYEERRLSVQARETNKKREPVHGARLA